MFSRIHLVVCLKDGSRRHQKGSVKVRQRKEERKRRAHLSIKHI